MLFRSKGGRPRDVPITRPEQWELLARVQQAVAPGQFVGDAAKTATQNRRRFYHVMSRLGVTKRQLGVVPHGLRHERANDEYEAATGHPSPVRGGHDVSNVTSATGRHRIARLLGHGRPRISSYYIGALARSRAPASSTTSVEQPTGEPVASAEALDSDSTDKEDDRT